MIKNIIIALQALAILFGLLWSQSYTNRMEQLFYSNHLRIMAFDVELLTTLRRDIEAGKIASAKTALSQRIPEIVGEMEELVDEVDPTMEDTLKGSMDAAALVDKLGSPQVSAALNRKLQGKGVPSP
ncbi:MAG: hypothetical protein A3E01_10420 [Gammaproteobacteria bacterium RIFCSPHIGHO2_12_FULL_63_22]|nr:MAG: hypothetical protein A3E01_10420 [Gammaproteobacteria bacterium RIFCSPHIGHO2_12_FULL_63_22]